MNAKPILSKLADIFKKHSLETILIGNAAASLQGAPVTTVDFDFMFRKTPLNLEKLKKVALDLDSTIMRPYFPVSDLYRMINESGSLQLDFMSSIHGINSFASLRSRSDSVSFGKNSILVASLADIIKSKQQAGRPRDKLVLDILKKTLHEKKSFKEKFRENERKK